MIEYYIHFIKIGEFISNQISLGQKKIQLKLALENRYKGLILQFPYIFYLFNN